jgi:serine/threonine protein kinase
MGQVLRARDIKLNRVVALKVLRADQRADDERRRRFYNEAQAASALNHPNIITIYDIVTQSEAGGEHDYLVMEFVAGQTMADLLLEKSLTYREVINYGVQMADALAAAHAAGIVHRDLKPGNVMVNERGLVKVLDFGLAKLEAPLEDGADPDATQLAPMTREGFIIGTCAYMSPEQAQGKPVDARSDIFSFGAVLYEMATRKRAFSGDNNITTLSAVLRDEPTSLLALSPQIPTPLERLIHRCLRKEPGERWQNMEEVRGALAALKQSADSGILGQSAAAASAPAPASASAETVAMQTPSSPQPSPFAAPPPSSNAPIHPGPTKWLSNKKVLIGIAIAAAIIFGPFRSGRDRGLKVSVDGDPEEVGQKVREGLETAAKELEKLDKSSASRERLDNDDILKMAEEKVPENVILGQIRNARTKFDLSSDEVIRLVKGGVSERVIEGMRNPKAIPPAGGPPPGPPPPPPPGAVAVTVPDRTPVSLVLAADIPVDAAPGTPLAFTVEQDLKVGDQVILPKGAPAQGMIFEKTKKRVLRGSKTLFHLMDADGMGGAKIRLRAVPDAKHEEFSSRALDFGEGRGKEFLARTGTKVVGYVDGEQQVFAPPAKKK